MGQSKKQADQPPAAEPQQKFSYPCLHNELLDLGRVSGGNVIVVFHRRRSRRSYARQKRTPGTGAQIFSFFTRGSLQGRGHSERRMAVISNLAMRRLADQILADATRERSKISPADVPGPTGFAPPIRFSRKRPASCAPAIPGIAPATTVSSACRHSLTRSRTGVAPRASRTPISCVLWTTA